MNLSMLLPYLMELSGTALWALSCGISCAGYGLFVVAPRPNSTDKANIFSAAFLVGALVVSKVTFYLGLGFLLSQKEAWLLYGTGWVLFLIWTGIHFKPFREKILSFRPGVLSGATLLVCLFYAVLASLPPYYGDEKAYHLSLPLRYLLQGGVSFLDGEDYAYFPNSGQMLFLWTLQIGGIPLPKMFNLLFLFAGACLIREWGRRFFGKENPAGTSLLYLSAPMIGILGTVCYPAMIQAAYFLGFGLYFQEFLDTGKKRAAALGLVFLGFFLSLHLTSFPLALLFFLAHGFCKRPWPPPLFRSWQTALLLLIFLILSGDFYLRNFLAVGNPFHPLGGAWSELPSFSSFVQASLVDSHFESTRFLPDWKALMMMPWHLAMGHPKYLSEGHLFGFGPAVLLFLGSLPFACGKRISRPLLFFTVSGFLFWFFVMPRYLRFLIPLWGPFCLLGMHVWVDALRRKMGERAESFSRIVVLILALWNVKIVADEVHGPLLNLHINDPQRPWAFLHAKFGDQQRMVNALNDLKMDPGGKILCFHCRLDNIYCLQPVKDPLHDSHFAFAYASEPRIQIVERILKTRVLKNFEVLPQEEYFRRLKNLGIRYLVYRDDPKTVPLDPPAIQTLRAEIPHILSLGKFYLYDLNPAYARFLKKRRDIDYKSASVGLAP